MYRQRPEQIARNQEILAKRKSGMSVVALAKEYGVSKARISKLTRENKNTELTEREIQVLQMMARGLENETIAKRLDVTLGTVKIHAHNIYVKTGVHSRIKLTLKLLREELFEKHGGNNEDR